MGVLLVALKDDSESFYANWKLWGMLADLLTELECDVSQLSFFNDSGEVPAGLAASWGEAILANLDRIRVEKHIVTQGFLRGSDEVDLRVEGTSTPVVIGARARGREMARRLLDNADRNMDEVFPSEGEVLDDVPEVKPLMECPEELAIVTKFGNFCIASEGFTQG